jgi:hypothetical protein
MENVHVKIKTDVDLMHEKDFNVHGYLLSELVDRGLRRQDNVAIYPQAPTDVARFEKKFEQMWSRSDNVELK